MDTYEYLTITPSADRILIIASGSGIRKVAFGNFETVLEGYPDAVRKHNPILDSAGDQLDSYFKGELTSFDVPLDIPSKPFFTETVVEYLKGIPYGERRSYKTVAEATGHPTAYRAIGNVCHSNPVPILIPCHRVVSSSGSLGGYVGGARMKEWLLEIES
jgi:methylated-DNA-[protein]-cysteine S-methyltransferase